jgi:hypothetical protein
MPLSFLSRSHGMVAFGFFNIETDMLLLENLFFFCDRFCRAVVSLQEQSPSSTAEAWMDGYRIENPALIGSLHGAIQGVDLTGFIGEVYRQFPFPLSPQGFRQKPYGETNQAIVQAIIGKFAKNESIHLTSDQKATVTIIEEFVFGQQRFAELIAYVDQGGYPRWEHGIRPGYVVKMMEKLLLGNKPAVS